MSERALEDEELITDLIAALKGTMRTMALHHGRDCRCLECKAGRAALDRAKGHT